MNHQDYRKIRKRPVPPSKIIPSKRDKELHRRKPKHQGGQ